MNEVDRYEGRMGQTSIRNVLLRNLAGKKKEKQNFLTYEVRVLRKIYPVVKLWIRRRRKNQQLFADNDLSLIKIGKLQGRIRDKNGSKADQQSIKREKIRTGLKNLQAKVKVGW